jgi:cation diffusion facilitator CzcD-associated flavoprotein CzcO
VASHLYSFSWAPNPQWSRSFSPQEEILAYLQRCAQDFGIMPHMRFHHEVREAAWDEAAKHWRIETGQGMYTASVLVAAAGALSEPATPKLPGLETFQGVKFHSATWNHDYDLRGKRVAVIGTGASTVRFVPEIQPLVGPQLSSQCYYLCSSEVRSSGSLSGSFTRTTFKTSPLGPRILMYFGRRVM